MSTELDADAPAGVLAAYRHRRRLVAVLAVTQTVGYGALIQAFTVLLLPMTVDLNASRAAVTAAATLSTLVGALAALPVGALLDRFGGRVLMASGSAVGVVGVVLWSQATSLLQLYVAFVLVGWALASSTYEAAFAVIVVATEAGHRDRAIIVVSTVTGLATSLYYPLTGWLESDLGWRTTLLVVAVPLAVVVVPAHLWAVPDRAVHAHRVAERAGSKVGEALHSRRFWLLLVSFVAQAGATSAFLVMMVTWFRDAGHPLAIAASLPVVVGVVQLVSRLAVAPLARRFGMAGVTAVCFAVQAAGLMILPLVGASLPATIACVAAFGLGYGVSVVARPSIVADTFGVVAFGSILAAMTVPTALSRAGAPLLAAWLADSRFLVVMGIAAAVAALALVPVSRTRRTHGVRGDVGAVGAVGSASRAHGS